MDTMYMCGDVNSQLSLFQNAKCHQDFLDDRTVDILKEYDVIGMTVTGAATRLHLLGMCFLCIYEKQTYSILVRVHRTCGINELKSLGVVQMLGQW